jgi:hypothetical protein
MRKLFCAALICLSCSLAHGYSYTALSLLTPEKSIAVNPFFYADCKGFVGSSLFLGYGMTAKSDIWMQMSLFNTGGNFFSAMVRYDLGKSNILALAVSPVWFSPQYHFIWENDRIALQANAVVQCSYDYLDKPAMYAVLSPVVKLFKGIDVFVEVNPGYYMQDGDFASLWTRSEGFGLDLVGGIGFSVGQCIFSVACPVYDITNAATPTVGFWFYYRK